MTDLTRLHAHDMTARLRAGEVSSRELTAAHLDAAEAGNHALNAWLAIDREGALAQADAADARLRAGSSASEHPLLGVPVALKDLISVQGGQCTAGNTAVYCCGSTDCPSGDICQQMTGGYGRCGFGTPDLSGFDHCTLINCTGGNGTQRCMNMGCTSCVANGNGGMSCQK